MVEVLLEYNADPNQCDFFKRTPLFMASQKGNAEIVKLLLKKNAIPGLKNLAGNNSISIC